jgi:hypothetical protein
MARIKIKQLDERIATSGVHFGGGPERRKLHPGEVVDLPEGELLDAIMATGKVELTMEPISRPLDYDSEREAKITAPTFRPRDPSETAEMERAREAVAARIAGMSEAPPQADSPAKESQPEPATENPPRNRRAARRAAINKVAEGEQEATA